VKQRPISRLSKELNKYTVLSVDSVMTEIEIAYDYDESRSEECASREDNGWVDSDGRYRRSIALDVAQYQAMRNFAERDDESTIVRVDL